MFVPRAGARQNHCTGQRGGIAREIEVALRREALGPWFRGAEIHVVVLDSVRDWKGYFASTRVLLEGGMGHEDARSLHAWMFMRRRDLPGGLTPEHPRGRMAFADHPDDVVLVAKRYVWMG